MIDDCMRVLNFGAIALIVIVLIALFLVVAPTIGWAETILFVGAGWLIMSISVRKRRH